MNVDAPLTGKLGNIFARPMRTAKLADLCFGENYFRMFAASIVGAVLDFVRSVARPGRPSQMPMIDAPTIAAAMGRVAKVLRAKAVDLFANEPVDAVLDPVDTDTRVAPEIDRERPEDAGRNLHFDSGLNEFNGVGLFHSAKHTHCAPQVNRNVLCRF